MERRANSRARLTRAVLLLGTALSAPGLAWAQSAPSAEARAQAAAPPAQPLGGDEGASVSEVIVTAEKRAQNLQDVPISIQALDTRKLEQLQIDSFVDYVKYLPSVTFTTGSAGVPGNAGAIFRGVATDGGLYLSGTLPTVGIYLDEQPITTISGTPDIHVYDIARVEALAGPQGTLFGASSEAGTIRIITNKPDKTKFSGAFDAQVDKVGVGGFGGSLEGYVNIPINDRMALRTVGWYQHLGGYIDNVFRSRTFPTSKITQTNGGLLEDDANTTDIYGFRAALGIDLNENWTVTPSIIAQRTEWNGSFRADPSKVGELAVGHYFPEGGRDSWYQAGLTITGKIADFEITYAGNYMQRQGHSDNDYSDYGFYYDAIAGSGAYVKNNAGQLIDPSQWNRNSDDFDKISQELRIATPRSWRLRGVAGLFYQRQEQLEENDYLTPGFADRLSVPGRPGQVWLTKEERIDRDYAIFAQADFDVTKKLTITGGLRGYKFDNSLVGFFGVNTTYFGTGVRQCLGPKVGPYGVGAAVVPGTPCTNLGVLNPNGSISPKTSEGEGYTWRANATYRLTDRNLVYFTASTGFRPGGINRAGVGAPFDADFLTNYEIGTKNTFFDRRLTANLTLFQEDWDDVQVTYQAPGGSGVALIANAGGARSRGVEGDFALRVTPQFTLTGAGTYVDARLTAPLFTGSPTPNAPTGQRLPLSPYFKGNLVARYTFDVRDWKAYAQLAGVYIGDRNPVISTRELAKTGILPSYATLDLTMGATRGALTIEGFIKNLTDSRGQLARSGECNINYCGPSTYDPVGEVYVNYIRPLTVGLRFGRKF